MTYIWCGAMMAVLAVLTDGKFRTNVSSSRKE